MISETEAIQESIEKQMAALERARTVLTVVEEYQDDCIGNESVSERVKNLLLITDDLLLTIQTELNKISAGILLSA